MLKAAVVTCALCAGIGGTAIWLKDVGHAENRSAEAVQMPSLAELHLRARLETLSDRTVKEPF
jgi:hypothetical protein